MKARLIVAASGALGLAFAAFLYYLASDVRGSLRFILAIPDPNIVIFLALLSVSLLEIGIVLLVLIRFASRVPLPLLSFVVAGFVGFAGIYALLFGLFSRDALGIQVLAAFAVVRWLTLFFIPLEKRSEF